MVARLGVLDGAVDVTNSFLLSFTLPATNMEVEHGLLEDHESHYKPVVFHFQDCFRECRCVDVYVIFFDSTPSPSITRKISHAYNECFGTIPEQSDYATLGGAHFASSLLHPGKDPTTTDVGPNNEMQFEESRFCEESRTIWEMGQKLELWLTMWLDLKEVCGIRDKSIKVTWFCPPKASFLKL